MYILITTSLHLRVVVIYIQKHKLNQLKQTNKQKKKNYKSRRRWNRTTEHISSPTDLKSALHTSEDHPRIIVYIYLIVMLIYDHAYPK